MSSVHQDISNKVFLFPFLFGIVFFTVAQFCFNQNVSAISKSTSNSFEVEHTEIRQMPLPHSIGLNLKTFEFNFHTTFRILTKTYGFIERQVEKANTKQFFNTRFVTLNISSLEQIRGFYLYTLRKLLI